MAGVGRARHGESDRDGDQLCTLPWLGFVPDDVAAVPAAAANRVAVQLGIPIADLAGYGARKQTRTEHLRAIAARLGWRTAGRAEWKDLEEFLLARAIEHDAPSVLFRLGCEYLQAAKIVRPGVISLMERIATVRRGLPAGGASAVGAAPRRPGRAAGGRGRHEHLPAGLAAPRRDVRVADGDPR
jgi:hypothetical protein